jgi:hypothetical protein
MRIKKEVGKVVHFWGLSVPKSKEWKRNISMLWRSFGSTVAQDHNNNNNNNNNLAFCPKQVGVG